MAWIEAVDKECYNLRELTSMRVEVRMGSQVAVVTDVPGHYGPVKLSVLEYEQQDDDYYIVGDDSPLRPYTLEDLRTVMREVMQGIASLAEGNLFIKQDTIKGMIGRIVG